MPSDDIITPLFEYILATCPEGQEPLPRDLKRILEQAVEMILAVFLYGRVGRPRSVPLVYPSSLQRVIDWMHDFVLCHIDRKATLEEMAAVSGTSTKQVCRLFRKHLGYSPQEAINLYRLTRSLIALRMGAKIETIALQHGFADASHYSRRFKAYFGMSPAAMRKAILHGYRPKLPALPNMYG